MASPIAVTVRGRRGTMRASNLPNRAGSARFTRRPTTVSAAGSTVKAETQQSIMPAAPMIPKSRKPRNGVTASEMYATDAVSAAASVPGAAPRTASCSAVFGSGCFCRSSP